MSDKHIAICRLLARHPTAMVKQRLTIAVFSLVFIDEALIFSDSVYLVGQKIY